MRRLFILALLALLPLQFSWAAVASYCEHETQGDGHFGHHEHQHRVNATSDAGPVSDADLQADPTSGAMDLDCGHCHGNLSALPTLSAKPPALLSTAPPTASLREAGNADAPARPERPQWLRLA